MLSHQLCDDPTVRTYVCLYEREMDLARGPTVPPACDELVVPVSGPIRGMLPTAQETVLHSVTCEIE